MPADLRELHGRYDVEAMARRVRNFRYAEEWMMMILGGWLATIPEVPVKTGLGKIIWECAQSGRRARQAPARAALRAQSRRRLASPRTRASRPSCRRSPSRRRPDLTIEKLAGVFDVLKPHLLAVYERTMRETDQIGDAPTIELLEEIVRRTRRHVAWGDEVLDRLCDTDGKRERRRRRSPACARSSRRAGVLRARWPMRLGGRTDGRGGGPGPAR